MGYSANATDKILILPQAGSVQDLERTARRELALAQHHTDEALSHARTAQGHWLNFYEACQALYDVNAHVAVKKSWRAYFCDLTGLKDDSRFRQLKRVAAHARLIEKQTGMLPTEWELREFPLKTVHIDNPQLVVSTFEAAKQTALVRASVDNKKLAAPNAQDYKIANAVIEDIVANRGVHLPEIQDATFAVDALIKNHILESRAVVRDNIERHSAYETVGRYAVTGVGIRNKRLPHIRYRTRVNLPNTGRIQLLLQKPKED